MPQNPNLSKRKSVEAVSTEGVAWANEPKPSIAENSPPTAMHLAYEQCLNRLGQQLSDSVTAHLQATVNAQGLVKTAISSEIFQVFVQELSALLPDEIIAVLLEKDASGSWVAMPDDRCNECNSGSEQEESDKASQRTNDSSEKVFSVCYVAPKAIPRNKRKVDWKGLSGQSIRFESGETLGQKDLDYLKDQAPERVWKIFNDQKLWGWLLLHSQAEAQGDDLAAQPDFLKNTFIEQSIRQCVSALTQVSLIQEHCQQRQTFVTHNQELLQTNRLKSEFLANTSHEIRTPLSSILGFTHLLQAQGFSPTNLRHQEYLNIILTSGQHLLSLINDILDLSKIEANQLDLQWETVDVQNLCQMAMTLVREKANDCRLTLSLEIAPQVTTLVADGLRVKQMLFNLLSNAIKFTPEGSVGVNVTRTDGFLRFKVWDTGTGISEEEQRLLFHPYSQLANAATGRGEGTGLGLALTQKLAELHGGWVELESIVNQGSCFTIALPLVPTVPIDKESQGSLGERSPQESQPDQASTPMKSSIPVVKQTGVTTQRELRPTNQTQKVSTSIAPTPDTLPEDEVASLALARPNHLMLVEDNIHNAKLMLTFLSKSGYEVTWVQDGREMWQALERSLPALILMDIHLPEVDGLTLTRELKSHDRYQSIPVIAQTALAMKGDRDLCLEAGAVDYISKPIDLNVLKQLVAQYIEGREEKRGEF